MKQNRAVNTFTSHQQNIQYHSLRIDEMTLIDTINRLSNQLNYTQISSRSYAHSEFLLEMIENLQHELDLIRVRQHQD